MITMYYCKLAHMQVSVVVIIWSLSPILMSLVDYIFYSNPLSTYNVVGIIFISMSIIILCANSQIGHFSLPGLQPMSSNQAPNNTFKMEMPSLIPIMFSIVTPIAFTAISILAKHLTSEVRRNKFNTNSLVFTGSLISNTPILITAIYLGYSDQTVNIF
jgi:drug/metabolite transporter (DMT)-like permease